MKLKPNYQFS